MEQSKIIDTLETYQPIYLNMGTGGGPGWAQVSTYPRLPSIPTLSQEFIIWQHKLNSFFISGLGIPNTFALFLCNDKWINTHHENNTSSMENISHPSPPRERYKHTKEKFILKIRDGTYKFVYNRKRITHIGRYGRLMWQNWFKGFSMHKYWSYLVQNEG